MQHDNGTGGPGIEYPCRWLYKVIGSDREELRLALAEIIAPDTCRISFSNSSSGGKYHCFNVEVTVTSEEERNSIYRDLKIHPRIKMVL